jgi:hypothetical protein
MIFVCNSSLRRAHSDVCIQSKSHTNWIALLPKAETNRHNEHNENNDGGGSLRAGHRIAQAGPRPFLPTPTGFISTWADVATAPMTVTKQQRFPNGELWLTIRFDRVQPNAFMMSAFTGSANVVATHFHEIDPKHNAYVKVTLTDAQGNMLDFEAVGTPLGHHWEQDGIQWDENGLGMPIHVRPHYGLKKD